jgi:hypothetical protein
MRNVVGPRLIVSRFTSLAVSGLVVSALAGLVSAPPARAETKIFFVESQPDDYGIDQCLASGATCGKPIASAYCQSRQYGEVVSFRKADPEEMPKDTGDAVCSGSGCIDFVAIECQR